MFDKKFVATLAIAAALSPFGMAHAQSATQALPQARAHAKHAKAHAHRDLFQGLNLTAAQRTRVQAIRHQYPGKDQAKARRKAMNATLTSDQRKLLKQHRKAWHKTHHNGTR